MRDHIFQFLYKIQTRAVVGEDDDAEDDDAAEDETADDDDDDILGLGADDDDDEDVAADDAGPFGLLGGDLFAGLFDDTPATKKPKVTPVVEAVVAPVVAPVKEVKPVVVNRVRRRPDSKTSAAKKPVAAEVTPVADDVVPVAADSHQSAMIATEQKDTETISEIVKDEAASQ